MSHVNKSTDKEDRAKWKDELDNAVADRKGHNKSMDIFLVRTPPGAYL